MSRSVWTHSDAIETIFLTLEPGRYCESCEIETSDNPCPECNADTMPDSDRDQEVWDSLVEDIRETLKAKFSSFDDADSWPERESHCILENDYAQIVISEYCGLVSLGVVPYTGYCIPDYDYRTNFSPAWVTKNVAPFLRKTWGMLRHVATFSNGEAVYERTGS